MNWFEKLIYAFQFEIEEPQVFGLFHFASIAVIAAIAVGAIVLRNKISTKAINNIMLVVGIALLISEVVKECIHSMDVINGVATWEYSWRTFPFQFCSVPMYLYIIAGVLRKGKVYDTILCFLSTFALFGGIAVLIYPSTVLSSVLFNSLHTMFWHGSMLIIGIILLSTHTAELKFKTVLKACMVFVVVLALAQIMNFIWHFFGNPDKTFSMFYISPYYACDIPVLHDIKERAPYVVFLLCYIVGFVLAACIVMSGAIGIDKLNSKLKDKLSH